MRVDLRTLKPNPLRDFTTDPLDEEAIEVLTASIEEDGFWGGIVCRRLKDGTIQIAAGHHRVEAALRAGLTHADVFVSEDMDDAAMVRIYARENATARGKTSTAQAGTVISAIRLLAKIILTNDQSSLQNFGDSIDFTRIRGHFLGEYGLGSDLILKLLAGLPGINRGIVEAQLSNLKASGTYARIIGEVQKEIEHEHQQAQARLAELDRPDSPPRRTKAVAKEKADRAKAAQLEQAREDAKRAREKAEAREVTFDFEGVAAYLRIPSQIATFRDYVTSPAIKPYVPLREQAALAKRLVEKAKQTKRGDISSEFIREQIMVEIWPAKDKARALSREEKQRLEWETFRSKAEHYQQTIARHFTDIASVGTQLKELYSDWPEGLDSPVTVDFRQRLSQARELLDELLERMGA